MLMKLVTLALSAAAIGAIAPAPALAHTLSVEEARRHINRLVHNKASYGYEPGSMILFCGRRTDHLVRCDLLYTDLDGDAWCGSASAQLIGSRVYSRMNVSMDGCESF
jgi:hypothetical protein